MNGNDYNPICWKTTFPPYDIIYSENADIRGDVNPDARSTVDGRGTWQDTASVQRALSLSTLCT